MSTSRARAFRRRPSAAERALWALLRGRRLQGVKFRRQIPVGAYVADFACLERRLVVEVDGPLHDPLADAARDAWLAAQGFRILRLSTRQVMEDRDTAIERIRQALGLP